MESRLSGMCTHIDLFSLILNYLPPPWSSTLIIHSHIYLPNFIDIHLKNLLILLVGRPSCEFDLLFDQEACWGLILVMSMEIMKSVGWGIRKLGFLLPDNSHGDIFTWSSSKRKVIPVDRGGSCNNSYFQWEVGIVTEIISCLL